MLDLVAGLSGLRRGRGSFLGELTEDSLRVMNE